MSHSSPQETNTKPAQERNESIMQQKKRGLGSLAANKTRHKDLQLLARHIYIYIYIGGKSKTTNIIHGKGCC